MTWADRIREATFTTVKLEDAYDMDQVDYLLDLLEAAAGQGEPLGPVLEGVEINHVRLREGYSIPEVDAFFAEVRASGGEPARPEPVVREGQVQAATAPVSTPRAAPEPEPAPRSEPAVPTRRKGFWARLFGR